MLEVIQALPAELMDALARALKGEMLPIQLQEMVTAYLSGNREANNHDDCVVIIRRNS